MGAFNLTKTVNFILHIFLICVIYLVSTYSGFAQNQETKQINKPREVKIGLLVLDIFKVDNLNESISGEFVVFASWKDSSYVKPNQTGPVKIPFEEVNPPDIQVRNVHELQTFNKRFVEVFPDGQISFRHRFLGNIHQKFDFRQFPFDSQKWQILLFYVGYENINLTSDTTRQGLLGKGNLSVSDWKVTYNSQSETTISNLDNQIQTIEIDYTLKRNPKFYIWKVLVPMILVVFMSWAVFWINPSNVSAQLTVSVTAILTLIAFQFSVAQLMPALPYLTALDKFTIGTDFFVFFAFIETIITSYLETNGRIKLSEKIDFFSRFIFPLAFLILLVLTFIF